MLPGPVFNVELMTTARRARFYALRVFYGGALLSILGSVFVTGPYRYQVLHSPNQMAGFGRTLFGAFATFQMVAILAITPSMVSGAIVDEKQRKTLHYLLASRLSGSEIVLGKLFARLLHVLLFLAIGLPILSLLGLFGGVDPRSVLEVQAVTASTSVLLASVGILISTGSRRVRNAIAGTYSVEAAWLFLPVVVREILAMLHVGVTGPFEWAFDALIACNPLSTLTRIVLGMGGGAGASAPATIATLGVHLAASAVLAGLAIANLRPAFRRSGDGGRAGRAGGAGGRLRAIARWRLLRRPPVGDRAVFWKEVFTSRVAGLRRVIEVGLLSIVLGGLLAWGSTFAWAAGWEAWSQGHWHSTGAAYDARYEFNLFLRISGTALLSMAILGAASASASAISAEREEDTWTSLTATPLGGEEILVGKMAGSIRRVAPLVLTSIGLDALGVACGSVHPFGFAAVVVEAAAFLGFATAMGTAVSLHSKSTWRAQTTSTGLLIFLNVGYVVCCCPVMAGVQGGGWGLLVTPNMPAILGVSLVAPGDLEHLRDDAVGSTYLTMGCILGTLAYGGAALAIALSRIARFDRIIDRPTSPHEGIAFAAEVAETPPWGNVRGPD